MNTDNVTMGDCDLCLNVLLPLLTSSECADPEWWSGVRSGLIQCAWLARTRQVSGTPDDAVRHFMARNV